MYNFITFFRIQNTVLNASHATTRNDSTFFIANLDSVKMIKLIVGMTRIEINIIFCGGSIDMFAKLGSEICCKVV